MPLDIPSNNESNVRGNRDGLLQKLSAVLRAAALTALGTAAGCGDAPSTAAKPSVVNVARESASGIQHVASASYITESSRIFDVAISEGATQEEPTMFAAFGGVERELPRVGTSTKGTLRSSSFRVSPPDGGWSEKDNGEHSVIARTSDGDVVVARFTVNMHGEQPHSSARLLNVSTCGTTRQFSLSFRSDGVEQIDATRLVGTPLVLRRKGSSDVHVRWSIPRDLRNAQDITLDARADGIAPGTYDIVLLRDVPAGTTSIPGGTVATITLD